MTPLHFIHISDTHITPDKNHTRDYAAYHPLAGARRLVQEINRLPFTPHFVLHTGDIIYDPDPAACETARELLGDIRWPVHYLAGNHDHPQAVQRILLGRGENEITATLHYSFEAQGVQVVCVDSTGPAPEPAGSISEEQYAWLESICMAADPRPLVVAVHHNVLPTGVPWLDDWMRLVDGERFHALMRRAGGRLRGVFHGHVHQNIDLLRDGVLYSAALSAWAPLQAYPGMQRTTGDPQAQPGYSIVTVTQEQTFIRRCTFPVG